MRGPAEVLRDLSGEKKDATDAFLRPFATALCIFVLLSSSCGWHLGAFLGSIALQIAARAMVLRWLRQSRPALEGPHAVGCLRARLPLDDKDLQVQMPLGVLKKMKDVRCEALPSC